MRVPLEKISTVTAKGRTTVPKSVRLALGVDHGGCIAFRLDARGVSVHCANTENDDPAIDSFLAFLADDIKRQPEALTTLSPMLLVRVTALTKGVPVDLDAAIDGDVDF